MPSPVDAMVTNSILAVCNAGDGDINPLPDIPRTLSDNPTFLVTAVIKSPKSFAPPPDDIVIYVILERKVGV